MSYSIGSTSVTGEVNTVYRPKGEIREDALSLPYHRRETPGCRMDAFFRFSREIIKGGTWAELSDAARAVLPVIMRHCDKKGTAFPSQERLSELSGVSINPVKRAIQELKERELVRVTASWTNKLTRHNTYHLKIPPLNRSFAWYPHIVRSGLWARMSFPAKNMYVVLLCGSTMEFEEYESVCDELERRGRVDELAMADRSPLTFSSKTIASGYQWREWQFSHLMGEDREGLRKFTGIKDKRTLVKYGGELVAVGLVTPVEIGGEVKWRVQVERPLNG